MDVRKGEKIYHKENARKEIRAKTDKRANHVPSPPSRKLDWTKIDHQRISKGSFPLIFFLGTNKHSKKKYPKRNKGFEEEQEATKKVITSTNEKEKAGISGKQNDQYDMMGELVKKKPGQNKLTNRGEMKLMERFKLV